MVEYCISQKFFSTAVKAVKLHQVCSAKRAYTLVELHWSPRRRACIDET
jgi:hypothetical protein